jgi:hypothetical protein
MRNDARKMMTFLAAGYEKLSAQMPGNLEVALRALPPDASESERSYLEGYCAGHIKAYLGMAEDLRKVLHDNPPSSFNWPRISLGLTWRF